MDRVSLHADSDIDNDINNLINTENTCSEQSQTDVLGTVTGESEPEIQLSEPVSDDLASTINKIFSMPLQKDKLITRLNCCLPPSNTDTITLKKCNEEIWGSNQNFMPKIRSNDIKLQTVQQCLLKSLVPLVRFSDTVLKAKLSGLKIDPDEALKACTDTIVLASNASQKVDQYRRDQFKPALPENLKALTTNVSPAAKLLFGDDLPTAIEAINKVSKVRESLSTNKSKTKYTSATGRTNKSKKLQLLPPKQTGGHFGEVESQVGKQNKQEKQILSVGNFVFSHFSNRLDIESLESLMANYTARNIHGCFEAWQNITSDHYVLSIIQRGLKLEFCETPVCKFNYESQKFSSIDKEIINSEVDKLLKKKVIIPCEKTTDDFSHPFLLALRKMGLFV